MSTEQPTDIPYGYCRCGCGEKTPLAPRTTSSLGKFKGQPVPYVRGHWNRKLHKPFEEYFDVGNADACWEWKSTRNAGGYGLYAKPRVLAHRVAYERVHGPIPQGLYVMHRCDNPPCVNPAHLRLGSHADNMRDMVEKGRAKGRHVPFTVEQVREIRRVAASGEMTQRAMAARYGKTRSAISDVVRRRTYANLDIRTR